MNRALLLFATCMTLALSAGSAALSAQTPNDEKLALVLDRIAKTSPEGLKTLEKVQEMAPEVNEISSSKKLIEIVRDYAFNKGAYNISPIGWEASQKRALVSENVGRWRIVFHYRNHTQELLAAEWEYNEETNKLYPFEARNAPRFF